MSDRVEVLIQGVGAMGLEMARALVGRAEVEVTGLVDADPQLVGRRLGDLIEIDRWGDVAVDAPDAIARHRPDVALLATTAFAAEAAPQIEQLMELGADVVTITQELVHPIAERVPVAEQLDRRAREMGRTVVAAGVNPGFVMDAMLVAAAHGIRDVRRVEATRIVDFSPYGPDEMIHIGAGLTPKACAAGASEGRIGHIGLRESAAMLSVALELTVDRWRQTKEPVVADHACATRFATIEPGHVRGFRQRVVGTRDDAPIVSLEMIGLLDPGSHDADPPLGDSAAITGVPNLELRIPGEVSQRGGEATAAVATNLVRAVLAAPPGLRSVLELPLYRPRH